jgi:hypothetical protein
VSTRPRIRRRIRLAGLAIAVGIVVAGLAQALAGAGSTGAHPARHGSFAPADRPTTTASDVAPEVAGALGVAEDFVTAYGNSPGLAERWGALVTPALAARLRASPAGGGAPVELRVTDAIWAGPVPGGARVLVEAATSQAGPGPATPLAVTWDLTLVRVGPSWRVAEVGP